MRKYKGAIISLLLLAVLVGAYFLISNYKSTDIPDQQEETDTNDFGDVLTVDLENLEAVNVNNSYGEYTLINESGVYKCAEHKDYELNQDIAFEKFFSASYYDAYTISNGDYNPADYGLDQPSMTVTLSLADGTNHKISFGAMMPVDDYLYYMSIDDRKTVYAVFGSKYDSLNIPVGALLGSEFLKFNHEGIRKISIESKSKESIVLIENPTDNSSYMSTWLMTHPYTKTVNEFTLGDYIISPLSQESIPIISYVEQNPADLAKYGLAIPQHTISFYYDDHTEVIKLGRKNKDGSVYAMNHKSKAVYLVNYNYFSFVEYNAFEYVDKSIYFAVITDLSSVEVKNGTSTYKLTMSADNKEYKINGKTITKDNATSFYEELASISIAGIASGIVSSEIVATFTYTFKDGRVGKVEILEYNARNYAIRIDGRKADFYVKKSDITDIISRIADL